ncbi:hypothetical protein B0H16DRAFT_1449148 [Mycena metata]|uniref:Uncharacterized protein n=1 Tax=Mycena metata TaxID=1033252 RepID=A0AAD7NVP2_9AGAR|nr:hypothetical protein B0H16DRAFT_1449148 [Mycena metata]
MERNRLAMGEIYLSPTPVPHVALALAAPVLADPFAARTHPVPVGPNPHGSTRRAQSRRGACMGEVDPGAVRVVEEVAGEAEGGRAVPRQAAYKDMEQDRGGYSGAGDETKVPRRRKCGEWMYVSIRTRMSEEEKQPAGGDRGGLSFGKEQTRFALVLGNPERKVQGRPGSGRSSRPRRSSVRARPESEFRLRDFPRGLVAPVPRTSQSPRSENIQGGENIQDGEMETKRGNGAAARTEIHARRTARTTEEKSRNKEGCKAEGDEGQRETTKGTMT